VKNTPGRLADLSAQEKRALLSQLLRQKIDEPGEPEPFPLSHGQRALWFLYQLAPESAAYNLLYAAHLHFAVDVPALQRSLQALVQRYPILTATYAMKGKEPIQRLHSNQTLQIEVIDTSTWSWEYLRQRLDDEGNRPFNLEQGPLLRVNLYVRSAQYSILSLTVHHIIADLWSLNVLIDELRVLYSKEKAGVLAQLPPVNAQFTDYIRWQADMLAGPEGELHWLYWQQKLAGELPAMNLPTDRPRPPVQTYRGASHSFQLSDEMTRQLRKLAQAENVTLYTLVLAVFLVLLFRYSDQEDLLIGTPMLGRNRADFEKTIGYFANPIVLRTSLASNPIFKQLLKQVRQTVIEAIEHQDYPFPLLVERLQPKRDPGYSPLIQTLFIWDKPSTPVEYPPVVPLFEPFVVGQQGAPFDLTLTVFELDGSLSADFRYNVDLFGDTTIARMEQHFQTLLNAILAHPDQHILDLPMLIEAEQRQILVEWNDTQSDYPEYACIHQLFETQVLRTPETVAVAFEDQQLTYWELNRRANQVAHALQAAGIGPDTLVGVAMERSIEMVIALLAILKAGGAYVPLEPTYPRERLAYMIQDAGLSIVLTQKRLWDLLPHDDLLILNLDDDENPFARYSEENPTSTVRPDNLVYMIYTSGSTGKPKGVMNIHRALSNRLHWMQQAYQLNPADRVMQKTPFSFDVSVWEFFWPLLNGARLVVARPKGHQDPAYLISLIEEQQITTMHFVPSMLQAFLEQPGLERSASLIRVICSGEALSFELQKRFFSCLNADLYNLYGPTEAAIDVTHWTCRRESSDPVVPIGHPIANTEMYILNRSFQPVPVGVVGELYIGGVGLARGYFNRPELTAEMFISDPFSKQPAARLFKTGDLGRYRPDGAIEFLGRIDYQVKIRGIRIELGEIEAVLAQHPLVKEAVVMAREDKPGNKRLVAFLVLTQSQMHIGVEELRAYLKEKLPLDMVPAAFVFLDTLPITSNGKVDRAALPAPDAARPELETTFVAFRTPTEEKLAQIWAEVLGIDRVGIQDNFFDLGGASIQSLQVVNRASEAGIELSPELLFEYQTIAELAAHAGTLHAVPQFIAPIIRSQTPDREMEMTRQPDTDIPVQTLATPYQAQIAQPNYGNMIIESMGYYLPPKVVSTKEVLEHCNPPVRFPLEQLTGIKTRRMAGETEFALDLAKKAIEHCLANSRYTPEDIDLLICSSISRYNEPDFHITFEPGSSTQLREHFGFINALAFDISNACTGMFTAMYIVDAFLKAGLIRRGMVVSGEYITHLTQTAQKEIEGYLDPRMACLTVGDAGAAVILDTTADKTVGFHEFEMYTSARYYDLCIARATDKEHGGAIMYTDSVKVSAVNIQQAVAHAAHVIKRSGWPEEAFQHIIMHQTSKMTIYDAGREINSYFGKELCHNGNLINNIAERGNTATTTHFVALMDHILSDHIKSNSNVVFGITGSGVNIGTAIYTFDDLPERLRQASSGAWKPDKVEVQQKKFVPVLPKGERVRVESIGTLPLESQVKRETLEMARVAAEQCLAKSSYNRNDIDLLIYAGVYRDDFICEPAIAAMVAGTLQINDNIQSQQDKKMFAFDIFNGPVGFLNACYTAIGMMKAQKAKTAMIVASEVENNREILPEELRGIEETASVLILDKSPDGMIGFGNFVFKSFAEYKEAFKSYTKLYKGRTVLHFEKDPGLEMFYQQCICDTVHELLKIEQLDISQVKVILPPQISSKFLDGLSRVMELNRDKFVDVHASHDLFSSSLPYALQYVREQGQVNAGDIGLIIVVGPGIQVGCATYYF
jgi:amino acid adenylation domain-containing protein